MKKPANGEYRSAVYTNRPPYADYDAPRKFMAIQSIVGKRLVEHPNAICSYSGGADSDILIDVLGPHKARLRAWALNVDRAQNPPAVDRIIECQKG